MATLPRYFTRPTAAVSDGWTILLLWITKVAALSDSQHASVSGHGERRAPRISLISPLRDQQVFEHSMRNKNAAKEGASLFGLLLGRNLLLQLGWLRRFGFRSDVGRLFYGGSLILQFDRFSDELIRIPRLVLVHMDCHREQPHRSGSKSLWVVVHDS